MLFDDASSFANAPDKAVTVFGMSGVGKTWVSALLHRHDWFHFSVDYRIGTRYMGEYIVDNFKREATKLPFLADLLRTDSIYISSNITFANLAPLSSYLGAPGAHAKGGSALSEYQERQEQHRIAEIAAAQDIPHFISRAKSLYGYDCFIADTGGSLIEVIDLDNPDDPVVNTLSRHTAILYIRGSEEDTEALVKRYKKSPKPMYYRPALLVRIWDEFKKLNHIDRDDDVDPLDFATWGFEAILRDRLSRYQALADKVGYTVEAGDLASVRDSTDFLALMCKAITTRNSLSE